MAKVTGLGGVFFKSRDPVALAASCAKHLGLDVDDWGGVRFNKDEQRAGYTLWSPPAADTRYFAPNTQPHMVNFRAEQSESGRLGWIMDPQGTRIELWQPPA